MKTVRAIVKGRVQGVWFRAHTQQQARELGVRGYVRNLASGNVEIVAEGDDGAVDALLAWAKDGSPLAEVSAVEADELGEPGEFETFHIRH